ncbi:DUF192 domain-containing protein [Oceanicaulis sp. LC35]|uniref:DUF192 domain-containing protein n=1 Tax=Oceanicaulis sp. LC35 TaxID=3349635 RepID=UPI003F832824
MMTCSRILALAAAALVGFGSAGCALAQSVDPTAPDAVVEYGGPDPLVIEGDFGAHTFTVEVADTDDSRERGLMHRESMDPDAGMLFDFGREDFMSIWMANTIIPLDILYVRANGEIAKIVVGAQPFSRRPMSSDYPVIAVVELNGGRTLELGIEPGDIVRHPLFGNVETVSPDASEAEEDAEPQETVEEAPQER